MHGPGEPQPDLLPGTEPPQAAVGGPASGGALAADQPCVVCGYNLRGLSTDGTCPECGSPVERSLQGNLLRFSGADYLKKLHDGVFLIQASLIVQLLVTIGLVVVNVGFAIRARGGAVPNVIMAGHLLSVLTALGSLLGWWLLSSPDPAFTGLDDGTKARRVVRVTVAITAAANVGVAVLSVSHVPTTPNAVLTAPTAALTFIAGAASTLAWVVWFFAAMFYLRWLAPRIPSERIAARAKRLLWLAPLLYTVGTLACGIGPLVALVLYYNLLEWLRKELRAIRDAQTTGELRPVKYRGL